MIFAHAVLPAPGPLGALTVGATERGLALVAFGRRPDAAARAQARLVQAARGESRQAPRLGAEVRPAPVGDGDPGDRGELDADGVPSDTGMRGGGPSAAGATAHLDQAVAELRAYLDGERRTFDVPLDWSLTTGVRRRVLTTLHETVPFGAVVTYGELAARSGLVAATASRGVGSIMGSNPLPVVVPCHRVLGADGLGGFGGGLAVKEWLLGLEGVLTPALDLF